MAAGAAPFLRNLSLLLLGFLSLLPDQPQGRARTTSRPDSSGIIGSTRLRYVQAAKNSLLVGAHRVVGGIMWGNLFRASFGAADLGSDWAAAPGALLMRVSLLL